MKKGKLKKYEGNITLFLVIVIPMVIISIFFIYDLIDVKANESKALKVAVACSEARLSRYNEFLFKRYGVLAYLEDGSLNDMIGEYYEANRLQAKEDPDMKIEVSSMSLNDPVHYLTAIRAAAPYVIADTVVDEVMHFLERNENVLKAQAFINDKIERYNTLSQKFERSEVHKSLENLIEFKDSLELDKALTTYRNMIDYGTDEFYWEYQMNQKKDQEVKMASEEIKEYYDSVWSKSQINNLTKEYNDQTDQLYRCYIKLLQSKSNLEALEYQIRNIDFQIRSFQDSLSRLYRLDPVPMEAVQTFQNQINLKLMERVEIENEIEKIKAEIRVTSNAMIETLDKNDSGLFDKFNALKDKLEQFVYSEFQIEDKSISLDEDYEYAENSFYTQNQDFKKEIKTVSLFEKVMITEYLMSISKTLVENEVRTFDPLNIKDSEHYKIKGEIEFLIGHSQSDTENYDEAKIKVILTRTGLNLIGIVIDPEKRTQLLELVSPIPFPWNAATYAVVLSVWSGVEGYYDWTLIREGDGVHFIKTDGEWLFDLKTLVSSENILEDVNNAKNKNTSQPSDTKEGEGEDFVNHFDGVLYYRDYMRIFINLQGLDRTILRHMELVEAQIQSDSKDKYKLEDFKIGHEINITGHFPYIFRSELSSFSLNFSNAYDLHFKR